MNKEQYMEQHHHIAESYIGLIRLTLDRGDIVTAKYYADRCAEELGRISKLYQEYWGV